MTTILPLNAKERGTYVIQIDFKDDYGLSISPKTAIWTLTDPRGQVIGTREDVVITTPEALELIVLSAGDLALGGDYHDDKRVLTVEWTFDSTLGSDLPGKDDCEFTIDNLTPVT